MAATTATVSMIASMSAPVMIPPQMADSSTTAFPKPSNTIPTTHNIASTSASTSTSTSTSSSTSTSVSSTATTPTISTTAPSRSNSSTTTTISALPVKPTLSLLKTPSSSSTALPSELPRSPLPRWFDGIKIESNMKTPITPPSAYLDFIRALSPALSTPLTGSSCHTSFSFADRSGHLTPITQPSSAGSFQAPCNCDPRKPVPTSTTSAPLVPPSPFVKPAPMRNASSRAPSSLHKLRIPQSPVTRSTSTDSPRSSGSTLHSPFSPSSWIIDGKTRRCETPRSASSRPVSVKQVVTRTVTYTRTPVDLDPAPKGKRRKLDEPTSAVAVESSAM